MKHLKLFFALFAMLALGVGNAWGAETLYKNALFKIANCTKNSSYTGKVTCTIGTDSWVAQNAANNNGGWDYVKIGAKKASGETNKVTTGTITTNAAYTEPITKIVVNGKKDRGSFTSKLIIASNNTFTTDKVEISGATSFTNNQITFSIPSPSVNKFYKLEFVCTNTTTTNGVIQVSSVEYYYEPSTEETVVSVPTFSVPEGTFYSPINVELSCSTADAEIHYTLDGNTPTSTSEKYTTAIAISETTTVKAIAVKDGLTDSEVAIATYTIGETVTSYDIDFETNALEAYVNWDFSNITIAKTITAKGGTYYGNTSGKGSASIKTKEKIQYPGILTFHTSKESTNTTASSWKVQVSETGTSWTEVASFDATTGNKGTWTERTADLSNYENVYVQISYGSSTAVRAIDEISLAQGVAPVKYTLNITTPTNGTLVVNEGETEVTSGATFKKGTTLTITATPSTGYKLDGVTVVDESSNNVTADVYADGVLTMPAYNVTVSAAFSVNEKPDATLTLSKNGVTEDITGHKQDDVIKLPSITSDCVKEFVGWSADENCTTEPEYEAGDEYTLAATAQTLYAVYATVGGGGNATATNTIADNGWTNEKQYKSLQIDANVKVEITGTSLSNSGKFYTNGNNWRLYQNESPKLTISTTAGELKSVKFTFTNANTGTLLYNSTVLTSGTAVEVTGTSATFSIGNSGSATNGQIRITKIEVVYTGGVTYSNYSTTCVAALDEPVFSVEGGENEAKTVTLTAAEGTIYYTLDGSTPTASSEKYTTPIVLDECGEYTIKAIAISSDSESPVASATYKIDLPILANSETDPYTETEAIEVYNGGCYDGEELVYVKGTVKTATFYTSGTYTITLTNGFQFYKFYKSASKELFTDGDINAGDVLVARGKLSKYNTTYQLAEGCYLVSQEKYEGEKTDISNTEETAYTVEEARNFIDNGATYDLSEEVYVKGIVSKIVTPFDATYGNISYNISADGKTTSAQLQAYRGLSIDGAPFASENDILVGDEVVVVGTLTKYGSTYEFNAGNKLVSKVRKEEPTPEPEVPAVEPTATFIFNTADGLSNLGITYPATDGGSGALMTEFEDGARYTQDGITMTTTNGTNTVTRVWKTAAGALDLRIYKGATLTLSVGENLEITNIVFTGKNITNLKVDNVAVDNNNSWAGSKQSVTFDVAGTTNIYTIAISVAYTRNVTSGNYGTICLPYGSNNYKGAKFYDIAYMELEDDGTTPKQLWLDEVIGVLKAGKPYIFRASSSKITIAYEGTAVSAPQEGVAGLTGTFNDIASGAELVGNYIIANNKFYLGNQYNSLRANRAYIDYNTIHNNTTPVAEIPGRRRVSMGAASENQATGVDNIVAPEGQAIKVIENGQLIIIRGGEKFNVQGQKL